MKAVIVKRAGYSLITVGFLAGALVCVLEEQDIRWFYFVASLIGGFAGVVMVRAAVAGTSDSEGMLASSVQTIEQSLARVVENIELIGSQSKSLGTYEVRHRIDELLADDMERFVEARKHIAQLHGMRAYADVMNHFAAGQRYINRVWSASADGYIDEVNIYLEKAQTQFRQALEKVRELGSPTSGSPR